MIRLLVLDVDGTMTDGGVYYDATGNELKKFAIKDGAGLVLARTAGIRVMICTGRECEAVRRRAADLKITDIYQNVGKKAAFLRDFMAENGYARDDVAYCGDDLNDLAAMALCAFVTCPADAAPEVLARADEYWSLGPLTLPHMLVRLVLAEQLYRAVSMLSNHPYHRA